MVFTNPITQAPILVDNDLAAILYSPLTANGAQKSKINGLLTSNYLPKPLLPNGDPSGINRYPQHYAVDFGPLIDSMVTNDPSYISKVK
jgi:hypothetical protein